MFDPIAERDLFCITADGDEIPIHIAIGRPYFPANMETMRSYAGCLVLTCEDPELATELCGEDEMEALVAGLEYLEYFLRAQVAATNGTLKTKDGRPFDPAGSSLLQEFRRIQRESRGS